MTTKTKKHLQNALREMKAAQAAWPWADSIDARLMDFVAEIDRLDRCIYDLVIVDGQDVRNL